MNTKHSGHLFERSKKVSPGGVHSPVRAFKEVGGTPRFIESAEGCILRDVDGNEFIDFCMSWGPLFFGHQDADVAEAVKGALSRGWSYGTAEPYSLELAELITSKIPHVEKIRFVNSGTEAVMSALRLARAATGRSKVVKFEGSYHGHVDSLLDCAGVPSAVARDTIVAPLNDLAAVQKIFGLHEKEIAVVILEPVPANNGLLVQTDDFIRGVIHTAKRHGALVLFDEVITGFRVAFGGMVERLALPSDLWPELVTYGKIIGGGFPVGAYGGRAELMDMMAPSGAVYQAGTLSANPVAMCAGLAMLKKLLKKLPNQSDAGNYYEQLETNTQKLTARMRNLIKQKGANIHVQNYSSMFWTVFGDVNGTVRSIQEIPSTQKEMYAKSFHELLNRGIYLAPSGYEVSFLSTAHKASHLEKFTEAFAESI